MRESVPQPTIQLGTIPEKALELLRQGEILKFIVVKTEGIFVIHVADSPHKYHRDIAEDLGIHSKSVFGGGKMEIYDNLLILFDYSESFGGVPRELLALAREMLKEKFSVEDVDERTDVDNSDRLRFGLPSEEN